MSFSMPETPEERDERLENALQHLHIARGALSLMDFRPLIAQHPETDWDPVLRLRAVALDRTLSMYGTICRWREGESVAVPPLRLLPGHESVGMYILLIVARVRLRQAQELAHVNDGPFGDYAPLLDAIDAAEELERRVRPLLLDQAPPDQG